MRVFKRYVQHRQTRNSLIACLLLAIFSAAYADDIPDAQRDQGSSPFFDNPFEPVEEPVAESPANPTTENPSTLKDLLNSRAYSDVFRTELPSILSEGQWRFRVRPKFGDFLGDNYVRLRLGASYNFSDYFETSIDFGSYFPNPFERADGSGFSDMRISAKYSWWNIKESGYNLSLYYSVQLPFDNPPLELLDGYARFEPSLSISKEISSTPALLAYVNLKYQFVDRSPFKTAPENPIPRDRLFLRPGVIYYPGGNYRYACEIEYRTNSFKSVRADPKKFRKLAGSEVHTLAFESIHEYYISPTITWFPTEEFKKGVLIPGNWDLGLRFEIPVAGDTQDDLDVSLKFNWYFDYKHYLKQQLKKYEANSPFKQKFSNIR